MAAPVIGIDLGTTYSCVAYYKDGGAIVIPNERGKYTTPSCVAYTERQRLVGDVAMDQIGFNPSNTIYSAKRLIGRRFHDSSVQQDRKLFPFNVVNSNQRPAIEVQYKKKTVKLTPEEVSAAVLGEMKRTAEMYLGTAISEAVITVPAHFSDAQRKATQDAGAIAGLKVLRIVNEPTAAAIAFSSENSKSARSEEQSTARIQSLLSTPTEVSGTESPSSETVLVFDFGGGTLDVSVLTIKGTDIDVKSQSGDGHLGGEDLTNCLVEYFSEEFKRKFRDLSDNKRALRRLYTACEKAKVTLSGASEARIDLDLLDGKHDLFTQISGSKFNSLCEHIYDCLLGPVQDALDGARLKASQIDRVLMVGGSTRVPRVREILSEFFENKPLCHQINPDEAVARGAAILAAKCEQTDEFGIVELSVHDVTPFSLGINVYGGLFSTIIPRNTPIPVQLSHNYATVEDNQTEVGITFYEGERKISAENNHLESFSLSGLPPLPRRKATMGVMLDLDVNGILTVTATDKSDVTNKQSLTVTNDSSHLSKTQVELMIKEFKKYKKDDEREVKRRKAMFRLEDSLYTLRKVLEKNVRKIAPETHSQVMKTVEKLDLWLKSGFHYSSEYLKKQEMLERDASTVSRFWSGPRVSGYV